MKHYFITIYCYTEKNSAHAAMQQYAQQFSRILVDEKTLAEVKEKLNDKLKEVNAENYRCKDLKFEYYNPSKFYQINYDHEFEKISISGNFELTITEVNKVMISESIQP